MFMIVLFVEDLCISYCLWGEWCEVVYNISFFIQCGEMLVFVGEFGLGKIIIVQVIIGLLVDNVCWDVGWIVFNGEVISDWLDKCLNCLCGVSISQVLQDFGNLFNLVKIIGQQVEEILWLYQFFFVVEC